MEDDEKVALKRTASNLSLSSQLESRVVFRDSSQHERNKRKKAAAFWLEDHDSRVYIAKLSTAFYALLVVIVGIVMELSNLMQNGGDKNHAELEDLIFSAYLYGGSTFFIIYCSWIVLKDHISVLRKRKSIMVLKLREKPPELLTNESTGSLYLRIGCVIFGIIGVVYYGIITIVCALGWDGTEDECSVYSMSISVMAAIFIFVQMWFVFCNGKIKFHRSPHFARFGLMHIVATNVWMWLRYILYEEAETQHEIQKAEFGPTTVNPLGGHGHAHEEHCRGAHCVFGDYSEFMYTCVVEYSLICAGVAFVFWTSIFSRKEDVEKKLKKRNIITMDCSRTSEGLFGGFFGIILCIIAISLFNAYSEKRVLAQWIFLGTNLLFFLVAIGVTILAFYRMKVLRFNSQKEDSEESAELLDQILLVIGLIGELVYCIGGIVAFGNNNLREHLSYLLFVVHIFRLIQVALQFFLLLVSSRLVLRTDDPEILRYKPGKQVITLMLMMNCALFLLNIFEAQKAGVTEEIVNLYGNRSWALLVRGCSPLTIFYRFHSSACFAEIWKKTFKVKENKREYSTSCAESFDVE